ncbi:uncharacterized protein PHACADRAFT_162194 [Phanerochaete carnosa HHB-10118-sp]|uniref:Pentacotripeptide-repeat region of PRORP domain-containing protein n=1 Tax=Phanerochaete carnosa (strain HHB-10118-sp) TaxID=650164 RepID=K5X051_PHACS|nr:uncharacterized protein PHACADRAFT_162194 [Phanerochaete carnosa HHB-10118-sp]EKM56147.1 hypothetical protein PHACADRAFT_162194 [Phanerochaete carnosa HHB-10118-sp]
MLGIIRSGDVKAAGCFWLGMDRIGAKAPLLIQAAIIDGFAALKRFDHVRAAWLVFLSASEKPTAVVYQAYIQALFGEGRLKDALVEFEHFERSFCETSDTLSDSTAVSVFNVVFEWLVEQSHSEEARNILDHMKRRRPKPDAASFNIFMKCHGRTRNLRGISSILQEMDALGMHGDIYTAPMLLPFTQLGQMRHSLSWLFCTRTDDTVFESALAIIEHKEARDHELTPSGHTFGVALCGVERRVWSSPSLADHYQHVVIVLHVLQACCRNPMPEAMQHAMVYYRIHKCSRQKLWHMVNWWHQLSPAMSCLLEQARSRNSLDVMYLDDDSQ